MNNFLPYVLLFLNQLKPLSMNIDAIRKQLRSGKSPSLQRRRKIALLSAIGLVDFSMISLYQVGVIKHMPDPPGKIFDSDKANGSHKAYAAGVPDGPITLVAFGMNILLASAGGSRKSGRHPIFDVLLGALVTGTALGSINYMYNMITVQEKACPYCMVGALLNFVMVPYALPDAKNSLKKLLG